MKGAKWMICCEKYLNVHDGHLDTTQVKVVSRRLSVENACQDHDPGTLCVVDLHLLDSVQNFIRRQLLVDCPVHNERPSSL